MSNTATMSSDTFAHKRPLLRPDHHHHCSVDCVGLSNTGRLFERPNLQNIPVKSVLGAKIRRSLSSGRSPLNFDYATIEERLWAQQVMGYEFRFNWNGFRWECHHDSCVGFSIDSPWAALATTIRMLEER